MTWNKANPPGSEQANRIDDVIREMKDDLEDGFVYEMSFPGADPSNCRLVYTGKYGSTATRNSITSPVLHQKFWNTEAERLEYWDGSNWVPYEFSGNVGTGKITTVKIADSAITTAKIAGDAVTSDKIATVTADKITGTITASQIANGAANQDKIPSTALGDGLTGGSGFPLKVANGGIATAMLADDAVTLAKLGTDVVGIKSTQLITGALNFGDGADSASVNVTIASVDTSKAAVLFRGVSSSSGAGTILLHRGSFNSATQVRIDGVRLGSQSGDASATAEALVIEWA